MGTWTMPFLVKSNSPGLTLVMLIAIACAAGFVIYLLARHHHRRRRGKR